MLPDSFAELCRLTTCFGICHVCTLTIDTAWRKTWMQVIVLENDWYRSASSSVAQLRSSSGRSITALHPRSICATELCSSQKPAAAAGGGVRQGLVGMKWHQHVAGSAWQDESLSVFIL